MKVWAMKITITLLKAADESVDNTMTVELVSFSRTPVKYYRMTTVQARTDLHTVCGLRLAVSKTRVQHARFFSWCCLFPTGILGQLTVKSSDPIDHDNNHTIILYSVFKLTVGWNGRES